MQGDLVIMVLGEDRPGIVERVAQIIAAQQGNWDESRMIRLAGHFAGALSVTLPVERIPAVQEALEGLESDGLTILVKPASDADRRPLADYRPMTLFLTGTDREGIVREVTSILARHEVNVDEFTTRRREAPMTGGMLFEAQIKLKSPPGVTCDDLQGALEALSSELAVDITLDAEDH